MSNILSDDNSSMVIDNKRKIIQHIKMILNNRGIIIFIALIAGLSIIFHQNIVSTLGFLIGVLIHKIISFSINS